MAPPTSQPAGLYYWGIKHLVSAAATLPDKQEDFIIWDVFLPLEILSILFSLILTTNVLQRITSNSDVVTLSTWRNLTFPYILITQGWDSFVVMPGITCQTLIVFAKDKKYKLISSGRRYILLPVLFSSQWSIIHILIGYHSNVHGEILDWPVSLPRIRRASDRTQIGYRLAGQARETHSLWQVR